MEELYKKRELDTSYKFLDKGTFRANIYFERGNLAMTMRYIPEKLPTLEELGMPTVLYEFCKLPQGLVLFTGPSGAGKSSSIAAMINWINENRNSHIVTIENPIEFRFHSNKSLIHQRELSVDTLSWENAIRSSLREDADIILIGEIRDYKTMEMAVSAAEKGHLVFATIHTYSASQTVDHAIGMFPEHQQPQIRLQLATVLEGIVTQSLLIGIDRSKRYPAVEILIANDAVRNTIREGNSHFIDNIISTNAQSGMISMEKSLATLVNEGKVELDEATAKSKRPKEVNRLIEKK